MLTPDTWPKKFILIWIQQQGVPLAFYCWQWKEYWQISLARAAKQGWCIHSQYRYFPWRSHTGSIPVWQASLSCKIRWKFSCKFSCKVWALEYHSLEYYSHHCFHTAEKWTEPVWPFQSRGQTGILGHNVKGHCSVSDLAFLAPKWPKLARKKKVYV